MTEIKYDETTKGGRTYGRLTCTGVGKIANALRRVLLDEIEMMAFDITEATIDTTDQKITHHLLYVITMVRLYEEGEFYLKVTNNKDESIPLMSDMIMNAKTHKPADLHLGMEIGQLQRHSTITIRGLRSCRGTGREHVKFKPVIGVVSYEPTDVAHVYYVNDRGFLEDNKRMIKRALIKGYDPAKQYILWNDVGMKLADERTKRRTKDLAVIRGLDVDAVTLRAESHESMDFVLTYYCERPREMAKRAVETIHTMIEQGVATKVWTLTAAEVMRQYLYAEAPCATFLDKIGKLDNRLKLTVTHDDAPKLIDVAAKKILKILTAAKI